MKKHGIFKKSILFFAMILPSCSLGMTQKNLAAGKAYLSTLLEKYTTDIPQFNLDSATISVSVDESYTTLNNKKKEVSVIKSSFAMTVAYASSEEKPYGAHLYAIKTKDGDTTTFEYSIAKNTDSTYTITTAESDRVADPNEDFYSYFDVPYILNVLVNRNAVRFLDTSLSSVRFETQSSSVLSSEAGGEETPKETNILTGYNINYYQNSGTWTYAIYSENRTGDTDLSFGFDDASYMRFFRYSSIDAVPASSIKYTFNNDRVSRYEARYSYFDEELGKDIEGKLSLEATYGEEREKAEI